MTNAPRILVVGGGIGGLTAAHALRRAGADVLIVERAAAFAPAGAGITIQANAAAVLRALGITLPDADTRPIGTFQMLDPNGHVLMTGNPTNVDIDTPSINIHRADLHRALFTAAQGIPCRLDCAVEGVEVLEDGVRATLSDGNTEQYDLVVGADGVHSAVRRALLGHGPNRYSGQTCWRFAIKAPDLVPELTTERWTPGQRVGIVPLSRGRIYVYLVKTAPEGTPSDTSTSPDALAQQFAGTDPRLDAVFGRLDSTTPIHHADLVEQPRIHYGSGRVVLIGDAAHAMTPNMGQGAGMAIEDAGALALLLAQHRDDLSALPGAMARRRLKRVREVQATSWRIGQMAHLQNPALRWLRDAVLSHMPTAMTEKQAHKLWEPGLELARELEANLH